MIATQMIKGVRPARTQRMAHEQEALPPPSHELSLELRGKENWSGRLLMGKETPIMKSLNLKCIGL